MPKLIKYKNEMIRINSDGQKIEFSTNNGSSWNYRTTLSSSFGKVIDLLPLDNEIIMVTDKRIMYSTNKGASWNYRTALQSSWGTPQSLTDNGNEIILMTDKKLLYSTNKGASWNIRKNL